MTATSTARFGRRGVLISALAAVSLASVLGASVVLGTGQDSLAGLRQSTAAFHDLSVAQAAGYGRFYLCTDHNGGAGAMGQHYVKGSLVGDPAINPLTPEVLIYEPKPDGSYRLVGVEYVVFKADWDATHASPPSLFGRNFALVPAGNRYGLPDFYQIHVWLWRPNPSGMFNDWNPKVSCRGMGDPA
jgi:hypothetical protein